MKIWMMCVCLMVSAAIGAIGGAAYMTHDDEVLGLLRHHCRQLKDDLVDYEAFMGRDSRM